MNSGNDIQFAKEKKEQQMRDHAMLLKAKDLEQSRRLVTYRKNATTILLVTLEKKRRLEQEAAALKQQLSNPNNRN